MNDVCQLSELVEQNVIKLVRYAVLPGSVG